jgi:carbon-monoxide dehydrogenase medium subunit
VVYIPVGIESFLDYRGGAKVKTFYRRLPRFEYERPVTVDKALSLLGEFKGQAKVLAGGTDLIPWLRRREAPKPGYVIDLKAIPGLDAISYDPSSGLKLGPLVTIAEAARSSVIAERFAALSLAALSMASPQVRNRGTIAGNISMAVPSADSAPALMALDASITLIGPAGQRVVPIDRFFTGPRQTVLADDELLYGIAIPEPPASSTSVYLKLSPRHSMDLAVVGVAAWAVKEDGVCKDARIGLGAVAPTPIRAPQAEAMLKGKRVTKELVDEAARYAVTQCSPIDDHRASREYRCDMAYVMTRRALTRIFGL